MHWVVKLKGYRQYRCDVPDQPVPQWYWGEHIVKYADRSKAIESRDEMRALSPDDPEFAKTVIVARVRTAADLREERKTLRTAILEVKGICDEHVDSTMLGSVLDDVSVIVDEALASAGAKA